MLFRRIIILNAFLCASFLVSATSSAIAIAADDDDFNKFAKQQNAGAAKIAAEFETYKQELNAAFKDYKKVYKKALSKQSRVVKKVWGDYRPGTQEKWVSYDKSGLRKSVNYRNGEVEIEILVDKNKSADSLKKQLSDQVSNLFNTSVSDAFKKDIIAQTVEKSLAKKKKFVKKATVSKKPVMAPLMPSLLKADAKQRRQISKKVLKSAKTDERPAKIKGKKIVRLKFKIPADAPQKSKQFLPAVKKTATKEKLPIPLIFAVIESESAFNPMAKSPIPAYGLMQIVPTSAGIDATEYLFGKGKILAPSYLYNSGNNIELGGAYLHILYFKYLRKIKDPVSRLYCTIAAYNTGAGNVAKAFIGTTNISKASRKINSMSPKQVYKKLRRHLPYKETQHYLKNVAVRMQKYQ